MIYILQLISTSKNMKFIIFDQNLISSLEKVIMLSSIWLNVFLITILFYIGARLKNWVSTWTAKFSRMTRRRNEPQYTSADQFDVNVETLHGTVRSLGDVSKAIGEEINRQNDLLDRLNEDFQKGMITVNKLVTKVKGIISSSQVSPMTLTLLFVFFLVIFLWIYWKWAA